MVEAMRRKQITGKSANLIANFKSHPQKIHLIKINKWMTRVGYSKRAKETHS